MNYIEYSWDDKVSHPPCPGRYQVYREKCDKVNFMQWNGSGWSSDGNAITHWKEIDRPNKSKITRLEVIGPKGREYTNYNVESIEDSLQDEGRTLKIFLT